MSPTSTHPPPNAISESPGPSLDRPAMPARELSEKEIVQMNTELNAGGAQRRNSSNPRGSVSRRQSSNSGSHEEANPRLKWDEANLYLNEGQMGGKMKIDEPKTPFVKNYDPAEDEAEISALNAEQLNVDELDMSKQRASSGKRESDIPGLDLGEPEMERKQSNGGEEKQVLVEKNGVDPAGRKHDGDEAGMTGEELEKHRKFEEMRKKHYEMKDVKSLLG